MVEECEDLPDDDYSNIPELTREELDALVEKCRIDNLPGEDIPEPVIERRCFVCDKQLTCAFDGELEHRFGMPPNDALCFHSRGNYGSTLFDPCVAPEQLEISICDDCVFERRNKVFMFVRSLKPNTFAECDTFENRVKNWRKQ